MPVFQQFVAAGKTVKIGCWLSSDSILSPTLLILAFILNRMKAILSSKAILFLFILLVAGATAYAHTDTLSFIAERSKHDTTTTLRIFHKFTWNVFAKHKDGKITEYISARPDTLFKEIDLDSVHLTAEFVVDTSLMNRIIPLHYNLEGSLEVRMNGVQILATGKFGKDNDARNPIQDDFTDIILSEKVVRFDITYLPYKIRKFGVILSLYQKETAVETIKEKTANERESSRRGFYYLAFGIVFMTLFLFFKEKTENLYFSMFCIFAALAYLWGQLHTDILYHLHYFFGIFCFEFLSIFFCKILKNKEKSKIPLLLIACMMLVCFLPVIRFSIVSFRGVRLPWFIVLIIIMLYLYACISTLFYLVQGIGQKRWEARAVLVTCLVPLIVFLLAGVVLLMMVAANGPKGYSRELFSTLLGYVATSIVYMYPLAAVFILGRRNGINQRKLAAQVKSIQQLSDENLAKEREKQDILERQKELLEKEVAQRTAEIVDQKEKIEKQHGELKVEKEKSDVLLRNILPQEVADELKEKGYSDARQFESVTVLFADFVDFTKAGSTMLPKDLVNELHACFKKFDEIITAHRIEKIKTIGDAYLAVCGLPVRDEAHADNVIAASKDIMDFMKQRRKELGDKTFDVRVGIHSGSVVAGIVGVKKFAYDIWGDTVNTAARMEHSSEPGKINISQATYDLVKDKVPCTYRGEIDVKGKGLLKMYFVS